MPPETADYGVLVVRHPRENRRKCTLEPLRDRPWIRFQTFRPGRPIELAKLHILLEVGAPPLTPGDAGPPLLLLDATWRLLPAMRRAVRGPVVARSLPEGLATAYPRRSKTFADPARGLASVEALYAALRILGRRDDTLLEAYHWRETFLERCAAVLRGPLPQ